VAEAVLKKRVPSTNGKSAVVADPRPVERVSDHPLARCKPRGDRVVVRRDVSKEGATKGGILLPDSFSTEKRQTGEVVSVGPGLRHPQTGELIPLDIKKGDRVIITGYAGLEIKDPMNVGGKDEEFIILREEDVLAVMG